MSSTVDVTFTPSSNTTMCEVIHVFQDGAVEDQEEFAAGLSSNDLAVNFTNISTASIFISDNDSKCLEQISKSSDAGSCAWWKP